MQSPPPWLFLAIWAGEIADHIERVVSSEERWRFGNLSGIVGAQNSFVELSDVETARKLQQMVYEDLGLRTPLIDPHTRLDRFSGIPDHLCGLTGSLGKRGLNIREWRRSEVMEVHEPWDDKRHGSTAAPHKSNPEFNEIVEGLAVVCRGLASAMRALHIPATRDSIRIPVEFTCIHQLYMMTAGALGITCTNMAGLVIHAVRMRDNVRHRNVLVQAASERLMMAIYKKTGEKDRTHTLLHKLAAQSNRSDTPFREVVSENSRINALFSSSEMDALMDPSTYTGTASHQTEQAVEAIRNRLPCHRKNRGGKATAGH